MADISARVVGCETRAPAEDVDVLHDCKLGGCHALEVRGGDGRHWEGKDLDVWVAKSVSNKRHW